ncbi:hypothetical protein [Streptomyces somaliensis]|uniref:hypothetical protein n=1 Tax=Streptomyces somaliensis TaxID=78355 RepID=UPI0034E946A2|nr:hypothetical protein [Streptomyces somaliensis]
MPAWLPAFPAWVATGLLLPIAVGFPLNALAGLLGGGRPAAGPSEPFLDAWVFTVVYGGFTVQGLALGTLFVRYAGRRWSPLWRGAVRDLPPRVAAPGCGPPPSRPRWPWCRAPRRTWAGRPG